MSAPKQSQETRDVSAARRRAELILKVRNGECTATAAAAELGISRKNYYRWEKRAFQGMVDALAEKDSGRPELPPEIVENRQLKEFIKFQEKELDKARQAELLIRRAYELKIREIKGRLEKKSGGKAAG